MQNLKFVVRWTDPSGKTHKKEYDDEKSAIKAKQWVFDQGATSADVAVVLVKKEHKENE